MTVLSWLFWPVGVLWTWFKVGAVLLGALLVVLVFGAAACCAVGCWKMFRWIVPAARNPST